MECSSCHQCFQGDDVFTLGWVREHNPDTVRHLSERLSDDYLCRAGTICPHCGYANDAPGYAPGDEIPRQDKNGEWFCATRYIPPRVIMSVGEAIMTTYMTPEEIVKGGK